MFAVCCRKTVQSADADEFFSRVMSTRLVLTLLRSPQPTWCAHLICKGRKVSSL
jgi:hypothetical protein